MYKLLSIMAFVSSGYALNACELHSLLQEANHSHKKRIARVKRNIKIYGKFNQSAVFPDGEILSGKLIIDSNAIEPITQERFGKLDGRNLILVKYASGGMVYYRAYSKSAQLHPGNLDPVSRQPIIEVMDIATSDRYGHRVRNTERGVCNHCHVPYSITSCVCFSCGLVLYGSLLLMPIYFGGLWIQMNVPEGPIQSYNNQN